MSPEPEGLHPDGCGADVAAYVLGALDPHELESFRRHLRGCSVCQAEVETLQGTVDVLATAAPAYPLPSPLRRRIVAEVRADAKASSRGLRAAERRSAGLVRVPRYAPGAAYRPGLVSAGAMLALVLALVLVGVFAAGPGRHGGGSAPTPGGQVDTALTGAGQVIVRGGRAELVVDHLPQLQAAKVYEVWLQHGRGAPQPTSTLFRVDAHGASDVTIDADLTGATKLLVTPEPAGGTATPTHAAVFSARI